MKIFSIILPGRVSTLLISEFALTLFSFFVGCLVFVQGDAKLYFTEERGWLRIIVAAVSVSLGLFVNNLYAKPQVESRVALVLQLCNVAGIALITQGLLTYLASGISLPRAVLISGGALALVFLFLWRLLFSSRLMSTVGLQQILFVGVDSVTEEIAERIRLHPEMGFQVAGYLAGCLNDDLDLGAGSESAAVGPYLGTTQELETVAAQFGGALLVVANAGRDFEQPLAALLRLASAGVNIEEASTAYETICGRVCSRELRPYQIIFFDELPAKPGSVALQSIYTNLLALAAIIAVSPLLLVAALAVKLTSRGPLLDRDVRIGLHGIPFSLHHFRCHRLDRTAVSREDLETFVGRVLKALHLVNLPRLFNLLRGEITLVGPKPEKPEFVRELSRYFAFYGQRHSIKPGMTGWSQIHTRAEGLCADSLRQLEYDLYYTKHISLALDAYILLHGIRAMLPFARESV